MLGTFPVFAHKGISFHSGRSLFRVEYRRQAYALSMNSRSPLPSPLAVSTHTHATQLRLSSGREQTRREKERDGRRVMYGWIALYPVYKGGRGSRREVGIGGWWKRIEARRASNTGEAWWYRGPIETYSSGEARIFSIPSLR